MTGEEILRAVHDATPDDDGGTFERLCGLHEPEVVAAIAAVLAAFDAGRFIPAVLVGLVFNIGVYCADRGLASTIPEIQERRRQP